MVNLLLGQPVQRQQQPAAQLLVHRVMPVADRGLSHLRDQRLRVAQQQMLQLAVAIELILQPRRSAGKPSPRSAPAPGSVVVSPPMNSAMPMAFVAHHRDFRRGAVLDHVQQRDDGVGRKIDMAQRVARLVQHATEGHRNELQMRVKPSALGLWQRS
jgi:hypothetical protein